MCAVSGRQLLWPVGGTGAKKKRMEGFIYFYIGEYESSSFCNQNRCRCWWSLKYVRGEEGMKEWLLQPSDFGGVCSGQITCRDLQRTSPSLLSRVVSWTGFSVWVVPFYLHLYAFCQHHRQLLDLISVTNQQICDYKKYSKLLPGDPGVSGVQLE